MKQFQEYRVWDAPTRWFHWINALTTILLIFLGLIFLFRMDIGFTGINNKIALKKLHSSVGYVFVVNLLFRFVWAFTGNIYARWSAFIPTLETIKGINFYLKSFIKGKPQQFIGHNPLGRLAVTFMFILLFIMAVTGLVRAGTDIFYPPFGSIVATYIAKPDVDPGIISPYDQSLIDENRYAYLNKIKVPFGLAHSYTAYLLMFMIAVHISGVVVTEIRKGGGIISAMFSGYKLLSEIPEDNNQSSNP